MSETRTLASFAVNTSLDDFPRDVRDEAKRAILNFVGCALGGCREPAMDIAVEALGPFFGAPTASVLGREEQRKQRIVLPLEAVEAVVAAGFDCPGRLRDLLQVGRS